MFPVHWTGQQAVVTLPGCIDSSNTHQVRDQLLRIISRGAAVLIADMTGTVYCDYTGAYALARAQQRAIASGTELRLVATCEVARRVLTVSGLGRPVAVYPDLDGAIAAGAESRNLHGEEESQVVDRATRAEELHPGLTASTLSNGGSIPQTRTGLPSEWHRAAHHRSPPSPR
jgi:anti-sigma B factor antagonist